MELSPRVRRLGPLAGLCLLGLLAYANGLAGGFHFDDSHSIVENPWIRSFRFLPRWFTDSRTFSVLPQNQDWRPMVLLAHALSYALGGFRLAPWAFHAVNLGLHLACACLTFLCARELLRRGTLSADALLAFAFLAGAIFAVHPMQSETVDYLSSRSEGLTALGLLAGFYCHLRGKDLGALAWLAFGLSAKAVAIVLPALVYLHEVYLEELPWLRLSRRRLGRYAGYAAVCGAYLAVRHYLVSDFSVQHRADTGRLVYAMTEVRAVWHYLGLYLLPVGQCGDANYRLTTAWTDPDFLRAAAAWLALGLLCVALRRRARLPIFGLLWFLIVLAPTSTFLPLAEAVNEHRPYAGVAGLAWGTVWLFSRLPAWARGTLWERPLPRAIAAAAVLLGWTGVTWQRNRVWADDLSLWADVVEKAPDNGRGHLNYGLALAAVGRSPEALAQYDECAKAWPAYSYCPLDRGVLLASLGRKPEAFAEYRKAERLDPDLFWTPYYEGMLLRGEDARASRDELLRATQLSPGFPAAHRELGSTLYVLGDRDGARREIDAALALDGGDGEALGLRGLLEELAGDRQAAQADDRRALDLKPSQTQPRINLGWMAEEDKRFSEARDWYLSAARLAPDDQDLWRRVARASAAAGDHAQEVQALAKAAELEKKKAPPPPPARPGFGMGHAMPSARADQAHGAFRQ
ncbi:MAG: tetratricopeptide repeat protein [Myxococcales bacterium]